MKTSFATIRALKTQFAVVKNSCDEFAIKVDKAELDNVHGPAILKFLTPTHVWSAVWDDATKDWLDVPNFKLPGHGEINEAFVRAFGSGLMVSFTDKRTPLSRWGFTAANVEAIATE